MARVIYQDLTSWLTHFLHQELEAARTAGLHTFTGIRISDAEWTPDRDGGTAPAWQVIVRDDGATRTSILTGDASAGITVLGGSKDRMDEPKRFADLVYAIASDCAGLQAENPVAAVTGGTSPVPVVDPSAETARLYMTLDLVVVGRALEMT